MSLKSLEQVLEVFLVIERYAKSIYCRYRYNMVYDTIYVQYIYLLYLLLMAEHPIIVFLT